ncbi:MAG: GNAT family N-acetyltransferase [Calditrichaeota bacterium]|nr:GNAT family N-acetyltransferase [Calditrichota bacterium]
MSWSFSLSEFQIIRCDESKIDEIEQIGKITFLESFSKDNTAGNMNDYIKKAFNRKQISSELKNKDSHFYMVYKDKEAMAYLKLNSGDAQTEMQDPKAMEIERLYVLQSHKKQGIGRQLIELAKEKAIELHASFLWLGVWEKNDNAIAFYKKLGFNEFATHVFQLGDDAQTDILMRCDLSG